MKPRTIQPAFTLLEVLVAVAIVGMISAGLAASMHVAFKARRSATEGADSVRAVRVTLDFIGRDLQNALPPGGSFAGSFTGEDSIVSGEDADTVSFAHSADPARSLEGASDIERVSLVVIHSSDIEADAPRDAQLNADTAAVSGDENDTVLVRRVTRRLLASVADAPADQVLCRGVRGFNLRYFDGSQWSNSWSSSTRENALPVAVEVTLSMDRPGRVGADGTSAIPYVRVYQIPCGTPSTLEDPDAPPPLEPDTP